MGNGARESSLRSVSAGIVGEEGSCCFVQRVLCIAIPRDVVVCQLGGRTFV
jgi:hypothetical protein